MSNQAEIRTSFAEFLDTPMGVLILRSPQPGSVRWAVPGTRVLEVVLPCYYRGGSVRDPRGPTDRRGYEGPRWRWPSETGWTTYREERKREEERAHGERVCAHSRSRNTRAIESARRSAPAVPAGERTAPSSPQARRSSLRRPFARC